MKLFDLSGRTAVVIGGTSGLGKAIALGLADAGANVVATSRTPDAVSGMMAEIEAKGRKSLELAIDTTSREELSKLRNQVNDALGPVQILVNAAGRTLKKPTAEISDEDWNAVNELNVNGTLRACQVFYEDLASTRGSIINVASLSSTLAFHQVAAYSASKAAVLSLTRSLACEWAEVGIRVNALVPGVFPTELNSKLLTGTARGEEILLRTPMHRFGRPEEIAGAAVFLASDAASFVTGHGLAVDGGYLASGVNS